MATFTQIVTQASAISNNINQLPASITTVAAGYGYTLTPPSDSISGLPETLSSLSYALGTPLPPSAFAQVAYYFLVGSTVAGAGVWSSTNISALTTTLSGVNRY